MSELKRPPEVVGVRWHSRVASNTCLRHINLQNLTGKVRRVGNFYIKNGEFSDLWLGEWVEDVNDHQRGVSATKIENVTRFNE